MFPNMRPYLGPYCIQLSVIIMMMCCGTVLYTISYYFCMTNDTDLLRPYRAEEICKSLASGSYDQLSAVPDYTRPITMDTKWVCDLYRKVKQIKGTQVTLLMCDSNYLHVLVNWLAHAILYAFQPVNSILLIAFDSFTYRVLHHKGFQSVYIPPHEVINSKNSSKKFAHIWITRVTITRLLNYWNYSVLQFDSDAIMLRNIQPILDKFNTSDIIASAGYFPPKLHKQWNAPTMCMGFILIKSSPATEQFWLAVRALHHNVDDQMGQMRMNNALDSMDVQWKQLNDDKYYQGITSGNTSLTVITLPPSVACRVCGKRFLAKYYLYVWHQHGGGKDGTRKKTILAVNNFWLLKENWNTSLWNITLTSKQWLLNITKPNFTAYRL